MSERRTSAVLDRVRLDAAVRAAAPTRAGRVTRVVGVHLEVAGIDAAIGDAVVIDGPAGALGAEVVAVDRDGLVCMPFGELRGLSVGAAVRSLGRPATVAVGEALLGRVLDGLGRPMDGLPLPGGLERVTVEGSAPHALRRANVDTQLPLGVRALDTLVPCGRGQRLGIFAGSGVGKSSLLSMIARGTEAPVSVLALIGERGREVREFLERDLGPEGLARSVVVVATSDEPALVRLRAASTATRIAEWFRDQGTDVVLMMDSLTRVAMAQREVGLSAGEPPATRGYPPSVFSLLPKLLERAGAAERGSITGLYTVLVEGDDMNEPIGDTARSILDGHVVLSRRLASAGHFPTIEVLDSISRVVPAITTPEQRAAATELRRLLAAHRDAKDLIEIGAYVPGTNPLVDRAVALQDATRAFLTQDMNDRSVAAQSWLQLANLVEAGVKRYQFALASVLRIRKVEEDQAIGALAAAERRRVAAEEAAQRRTEAHQATRPETGAVTLDQFLAARDRQERSASAVLAAQAELEQAHDATVSTRAALAAAAAARNALEQLDERRRAEHALENQRQETIEVDDLVTGRHRREHA